MSRRQGLNTGNPGAHVFVSYAAEDRSAAERLVRALEARGWQVWWDRDLPAGTTFDEEIAARLARAGAVIVLWSRHSADSEWVREEALDAKRRGLLVPAFIESVKPPLGFTLRHAVDLTAWDGSMDSTELSPLVAAVARLVPSQVSADSPSQTGSITLDERATGGWRAPVLRAAATLVVVAALGAVWYWDAYYRTHVEHVAQVVRRFGLPEGVGRLTSSAVARRGVSLAVVRRGRRNAVDEVRLADASGNIPPRETYIPAPSFLDLNPLSSSPNDLEAPLRSDILTVASVTFTRDAGGRVLEQIGRSAGGRTVYTLHYGTPEVAEYKSGGFASPIRESGIVYLRFTRVPEGRHAGLDEKVAYLDAAQRPRPDESGEYGYRVVFDERGLPRERVSLGPDLEDRPNGYGILRTIRVADQAGNVVELSNLGRDGAPVLSDLGTAGLRMQYDGVGNLLRSTFLDRAGAPVTVPGLGAAGFARTYDRQGRLTSQTLLGPDQQPTPGRHGFARQTVEWITSTRAVIRHFDASGRPVAAFGRAFEADQIWDARGLVEETRFRDEKGESTRADNGCSTVQFAYDADGDPAEIRCLNEQREPTISTIGASTIRSEYDGRGNPVRTRYFDRADRPGLQGEGYAEVHFEYTASGNLARLRFADASGSPRRTREGFAASARAYDARGNLVRESYFDEQDRPTTIAAGYAAYSSDFDERNREVRTSFLGLDGRPLDTVDGFATIEYELDARGLVAGRIYLNAAGSRVPIVDGYARTRFKRNERGQVLEVAYEDRHGRPTLSRRPGSGRRRFTYDPAGRVLERSDLDTAGRPMTNAYGYSVMRFSYDEHGRERGRQVIDVNGRPLTLRLGVDRVTEGSIAAEVGFEAGDVLIAYDGEAVATSHDFTNRLELFKGDRPREITVERGGQVVALDVPPGRLSGLTLEERGRP